MNDLNRDTPDSEFGIDSRYSSLKERNSDATQLMEARLKRMKNISDDDIKRAKLIQLKLKMEEYVKNPASNDENNFATFLEFYVDTIYAKRSAFATDIDIPPVSLSQVINNHREPKEEFIMKLMIHSEKIFKNLCVFQKKIWFQVYFHEKMCEILSSQEKWRPEIEKHVRFNNSLI